MIPPHLNSLRKAPIFLQKNSFFCLVGVSAILFSCGVWAHYLFGHWWIDTTGHSFGPDESFITYRYAQNFANGLGLVWNPGERVEGYSSILHLFVAALGAKLFPENIYEFCTVFNLLFILLIGVLYCQMARDRLGHLAWFPVLLVALNPSLWIWTASGFETPLVAGIIFLFWYSSEKILSRNLNSDLVFLCFVGMSSVLMHVDGFLNSCIAILFLLLRKKGKPALWLAVCTTAVFFTQVGFRMYYYGYPLNNPYYLKIDGQLLARLLSGLTYLLQIIFAGGWILIFISLGLSSFGAFISFAKKRKGECIEYYDLIFILWTGYYLFIGGDYFWERMLLSFVFFTPFAVLRVAKQFSWVASKKGLAICLLVNFLPLVSDGRFAYEWNKVDFWKDMGIRLGRTFPKAVIAVDAAGKIPFYSHLKAIDMLGYNESRIAHLPPHSFEVGHSKYDAEYILKQHPDLIAVWMDAELNGRWGLTRKLYQGYGYELFLMFYSEREKRRPFVIPGNKSDAELTQLIQRHWSYVLLAPKTKQKEMLQAWLALNSP